MRTLSIDRSLDEPVYEQVAGQLRRIIAAGDLQPGAALPTVRRLAGDLGVNLNTIARAYRLLESEGFLVIRGRAGATVAAPADRVDGEARSRLLDQLRMTLVRLRQAGMSDDELLAAVRREVLALGSGKGDRS